MQKSKRDFGSFHASNIQELLNIPEEKYVPPSLKVHVRQFKEIQNVEFEFGKVCRSKYFLLEDECTFLNHGAFGGVLKQGLDASHRWQMYAERQPLRFFDRELLPHLVFVTRRLASFVGCSPKDLVLTPNATTALNCVLRSQDLQPGDVIYNLSIEYGAVKKIIQHVCEEKKATVQEEIVNFPLENNQQVIDVVKNTMVNPKIKLAVFDHIPSNTPFILPVKELCEICHERGVKVLIDGAHALGQLDLDISSLGADYYVSNAHKWFCAPKGSAFMYVDKKYQSATRPLVISHGFGSGFNSEYMWSGLREYNPFLSLHTVLDFWQTIGAKKMRNYMYQMAKDAANLLQEKWKSNLLVPTNMTGSMLCVRLPESLYNTSGEVNYSKAESIQNALYHCYNIEVPVKAVQSHLYVRISAHIYNFIEEYEKLADAVLELAEKNQQNNHANNVKN